MPTPRVPSDRDEWEKLTHLIGAISITGRIEGSRPQSALIVGPPASGKSALLERYQPPKGVQHNSHLIFATNISNWGVRTILKEMVPPKTHIVVPEFQSLTLRKSHVWDSLLGILLPAMEEGVSDFYNGPQRESFDGKRIGLIASIASDAFQSQMQALSKSGFLSRVIVLYLNRTPDNALLARKRYNAGDTTELQKVYVSLPHKPIRVRLSERFAGTIDNYAFGIAPHELHRVSNRLQAITKAIAWLDGKDEVSQRHWDIIRSYESLWLSPP